MQIIQELYNTLTEKLGYDKIKWDLFKDSLNSNLRRQFFELFEEGNSEREIAQKLFRADIAVTAHRNTKFEIKTALYSELLKFRPSNYQYSPFQQAYFKAQQQLATLRTLKGLGKYSSVIDISSNLLKRSITYDFTDITVDTARQMCMFHSDKTMNSDEIEKFSRILDHYSIVLQKEKEVEQVWAKMIAFREKDNRHALRIGEEFLKANPLPKKRIKSYKFYARYYFVKMYCLELNNDLVSFEKVAYEGYQHFCELSYEYHTGKISFLHNLIDVNLKLNRIDETIKYIDLANDVIKKGVSNWFIYLQLKLKALLYIGEFTQAHETYAEMTDHRNFDHEPPKHKMRFVLLGAYVLFLNKIDQIDAKKPSTQLINKHLKYINLHQEEMEDLKVPSLLIGLLFNIFNNDFDSLESKIFELKEFTSIYLRTSSPNYRSSCFIKMLLLIPLYNYNLKAIQRHSEPLLKKLSEKPPTVNQDSVHEVIPYEKLWNLMLGQLEPPKRKRNSVYAQSDWILERKSAS